MVKVCVAYSSHKIGDLIWQLPYFKAISEHHKTKITILVSSNVQAKELLKNNNYIEDVIINKFRKGIYYFLDIFLIYKIFFRKKFNYIYILEKINRPAIAAYLARINNIIGFGIGNQKKWLTNKHFINIKDLKLNYSEQSEKFLSINGILINDLSPFINLNSVEVNKTFENLNFLKKPWITLGVDSFESHKIWPAIYYSQLIYKIYSNNLAKSFFLVSSKKNQYLIKNIIKNSKVPEKYFFDCSGLKMPEISRIMFLSDFFIGNCSAPLNLSAAVGTLSFGILGATDVRALKSKNIFCIVNDNYDKSIEIGINKHGDNYNKNANVMKTISVEKVFKYIISNLKKSGRDGRVV